jgi:hypothetical protein
MVAPTISSWNQMLSEILSISKLRELAPALSVARNP